MDINDIRKRLHEFIENVDEKKAEAIYTLFADEIDNDAKRKKLIREERNSYLKGEGRSYTWEEVKARARDKNSRHAL